MDDAVVESAAMYPIMGRMPSSGRVRLMAEAA